MKKAFFIDRDGVINEEVNYLHRPEEAVLCPRVAEAVRMIHDAGYLAIVVTNQGGVGRKLYRTCDTQAVHVRLQYLLLQHGVDSLIDGWYFCYHYPSVTGGCGCRKPRPGMFYRAAADFDIDLAGSFMIGDRMSDLYAGVNAGCASSVLVLTGVGAENMDQAEKEGFETAKNLKEAVERLLKKR